ncbi:MAG: hypothetical protein D6796_15050 [Caldilineae bacterium]|nr:MAG: hypothetical protein D6796_15050 [Caldilineae bacterium]
MNFGGKFPFGEVETSPKCVRIHRGIKRQASNVRRQASNVKRQASNVRRQTSGVRGQTSNVI